MNCCFCLFSITSFYISQTLVPFPIYIYIYSIFREPANMFSEKPYHIFLSYSYGVPAFNSAGEPRTRRKKSRIKSTRIIHIYSSRRLCSSQSKPMSYPFIHQLSISIVRKIAVDITYYIASADHIPAMASIACKSLL